MDPIESQLRGEIVAACREMNRLGINQGKAGNISARFGDVMLITPSGLAYEAMQPADLAVIEIEKNPGAWSGPYVPSTEWRFHLDILRTRCDLNAVVHTHSLYATVIGICGRDIPAIHYMMAKAGGPSIRLAKYAGYGTQQLSDNALVALAGRKACLLANHGVIATGSDIAAALDLAAEVENLARQYYLATQLGNATILSDEEIADVAERSRDYGQARKIAASE